MVSVLASPSVTCVTLMDMGNKISKVTDKKLFCEEIFFHSLEPEDICYCGLYKYYKLVREICPIAILNYVRNRRYSIII